MKAKTVGMYALGLSFILAGCSQGEETANQSIEEAVDYTFTGIEPGSGVTEAGHKVIADYENLAGWDMTESSMAGMLVELEQAINNEEPIIVTGFSPHWIFEEFDLKFLEDPLNSLGEAEEMRSITREGFADDFPGANQIIDNFYWEMEDIQAVMSEALDIPFEDAAQNWVDANPDKVAEWTEGTQEGNGEMIELVALPWDSERAPSHVMKIVLEDQGYEVNLVDVEPAIMFQAIAAGQSDASVSPWLPITHAGFYEAHHEDIVDLGANLNDVRVGIVVPSYMDIDSIEDLAPRE
ncbi:glycine betaine ABC transporter substrate-binding protein [Enterococcus olivae]